MTDERWEREALELAEELVAIPRSEWPDYFEQNRVPESLQHAVLELLQEPTLPVFEKLGLDREAHSGAFSETDDFSGAPTSGFPSVDAYRILEVLGEGGMGTVYAADQLEPIRRRVALKVVKAGMDTREVLIRFEAERQALAMMDHICIAKVFDAGATEGGRPYFAMEYLDGEPLTRYCDQKLLTIRRRLELFVQVCRGVQHAHQKGVIHRDLKPSNILVTLDDRQPRPRIIDFGIAKAMGPRGLQDTVTQQGQVIGTLEYMSPEQAQLFQDVDTRADVYSLGVILFELLVGALPFDLTSLRSSGLAEIQRVIREVDPPKPSTQTGSSDAARHRGSDAPSLGRRLRDDLDWITLKCLEKDRDRRYEPKAHFERWARDDRNIPSYQYFGARSPLRLRCYLTNIATSDILGAP